MVKLFWRTLFAFLSMACATPALAQGTCAVGKAFCGQQVLPLTAGSYVQVQVLPSMTAVSVAIYGVSSSGATLVAKTLTDGNLAHAAQIGTMLGQASITADGVYQFAAPGVSNLALVVTAGGTGSATVSFVQSPTLAFVQPFYPSGVSAVTGTFTASSQQSASFTPLAGRAFNIAVWGASTAPSASIGGTVYLVRSLDGGTTWLAVTGSGTQLETFSTNASDVWSEAQVGVQYALVCSAYSANISYRLSQ